MNSEGLRQYIKKRKEGDYLIVDVRQPDEYVRGHIPGARLIPIKELAADFSDLPSDKDLIFYCHSGGRSQAAAMLVTEEGASNKNVYNLEGGIMAWQDRVVPDYPKVQVFDISKSVDELLLIAMDLEKGAIRFYNYLTDRFVSEPLSRTFGRLSIEETAHARAVYKYWKNTKDDPPEFEEVFENLKGEILEGGENLIDILKSAEAIEGNICLNFIELALHVEKTMAEKTESKEARGGFLSIAEAEKTHMKGLIDALNECHYTDENGQ
jgi:rhodanese-related sulfurtransferase/rubrerythrin